MGVSPSTPAEAPKSSNDEANAFAAVHARILRHLHNHVGTLLCNKGHRPGAPPVWPSPSLASSGYVRSLRARASRNATPACGFAPLRGICGERTASCTPPNKGNPSAITSILLPSRWFSTLNVGPDTTSAFTANAGRCALNCETSTSQHSCRNTCGPVEERQRDGHTGTRVQTDEVETGDKANRRTRKTTESNRVSRLVGTQT